MMPACQIPFLWTHNEGGPQLVSAPPLSLSSWSFLSEFFIHTAFCLKVHTPGKGMVPQNEPVNVSWSRQSTDPISFLMFMENLIGGNMTSISSPIALLEETSTSMEFPEVGTFRLWAVNPANNSQTYAMSKNFNVFPNSLAIGSSDDGSQHLPHNPLGSAVSSSSPADITGTSTKTSPYIIGGAIAGGALLAILAGALVYLLCRRRKARIERRMTFHRTRMVKSLPPPTFAVPRDVQLDSPIDDKDGMGARYPQYMQEVPPAASGPYPFARRA
ncbi:hypothetical protein C8R44DRAFT_60317 [Mycena epipterygia]|nr:hypothetical protein C8R44DRAFT_60317 [Mycena epipterygia]